MLIKIKKFFKRSVRGKFLKRLVPYVIGIIVVMDAVIYFMFSNYAETLSHETRLMTVKIISDDISEVFNRYLGDLNMMLHYYKKSSREDFMDFARKFTEEHSNKYAYIRLIMADGTSYHTLNGKKDKYDIKSSRSYKLLVMEHKDVAINSARQSSLVNYDVCSVAVPIKNENDSVLAIISSVIPADVIDKKLFLAAKDTSEYYVIVDDEQMVRVCRHDTAAFNSSVDAVAGRRYLDETPGTSLKKQMADFDLSKPGYLEKKGPDGIEYVMHFASIPGIPWVVSQITQKSVISHDVRVAFWVLLITTFGATVVMLWVIFHITAKEVMRPLDAINRFSDDLARGKLYSTETKKIQTNDDVGTACKKLEKMQQRLVSVVSVIRDTSNDLQLCSANAADSVQSADKNAQIQNATVDNIAKAVEKLNESIRLNTDDALRTRGNSDEIANDIVLVSKATTDTFNCMQRIVQKVKVINDITSYTDILAINASVEALRAGEKGSGFAVVAAEIRKLSERCHRASTEINRLSEVSLAATTQTVNLVGNISPKIHDNAEMVSRISDACSTQLQFTSSISDAVQQLATIAYNTTGSADKLTVYAGDLVKDIERLNKLVDFFRLDKELDQKRDDILAAIEIDKSELLALKSRLLELTDASDEEASNIVKKIDQAIEPGQDTV